MTTHVSEWFGRDEGPPASGCDHPLTWLVTVEWACRSNSTWSAVVVTTDSFPWLGRRESEWSDHGRESVVRTGNLQPRTSVRSLKPVGRRLEAGGHAPRPNHPPAWGSRESSRPRTAPPLSHAMLTTSSLTSSSRLVNRGGLAISPDPQGAPIVPHPRFTAGLARRRRS
jgi:hypothetical protein